MRIKYKLQLGIGLLFAMILVISSLSVYFLQKLSIDTKNILVANYNTLDYSRKMQIALDNDIRLPDNKKLFDNNLLLQQKNITESGEAELTANLAMHYQLLQHNYSDTQLIKSIRTDISNIMLLNMQAIQRKNKLAENTSDNAVFWISIIGTICFIVSITLLFNLPGAIANPIKQFASSIKEIAERNYSNRLHFDNKDEFGELAASFNSMAEKLEEYQASSIQKLLIEKKRIETLINNMNDPVIGLDEKKRILFINTIAQSISGLKSEQVIGKSAAELALKNDLIRLLVNELDDNALSKKYLKQPIKIFANNKESYFEKDIIPIKIVPTGEQVEKLIGNVILLQNITPYKEMDFAKTNFIATISHELKTPLASIGMSLQLLNNKKVGNINDEQLSLVNAIQDDVTRLLKITSELLNISQVESGKIQLYKERVSVSDIVNYACIANQIIADNKKIKLDINIQDNLPVLFIDKEKTSWVLTNIISNAIRYSYESAIVIIDVFKQDDGLLFSIKDQGQGIPPEFIDKIFNRYFKIPGSRREGTGLGLSISKEIIEAQNGRITVSSEYGKGSDFRIFLPFNEA